MKLVFLSKFYNHHLAPLCEALSALDDMDFQFVVCGEMSEERRKLWGELENPPAFVRTPDSHEDWERISADILSADAVMVGYSPQKLLSERLKAGKLILRYQERPLKKGDEPLKFLPRMLKWRRMSPPNKPVYLLCASAYAAEDYAKMGLFREKSYKWGYFPEVIVHDCKKPIIQKEPRSILWAGRFLDWKHPDDAVRVAAQLRDKGHSFKLRIAGSGALENQLRDMISELKLEDYVELLGSLKPEQVRREMERSSIFLFTSDRQEGWGAVLNEAMNSGCAVIASDAAGSTPYLVDDGVNGLIYHSRNTEELYDKLSWLLEQPSEQERLGMAAHETMTGVWNADVAAERLHELIKAILSGNSSPDIYAKGPCSRA